MIFASSSRINIMQIGFLQVVTLERKPKCFLLFVVLRHILISVEGTKVEQ